MAAFASRKLNDRGFIARHQNTVFGDIRRVQRIDPDGGNFFSVETVDDACRAAAKVNIGDVHGPAERAANGRDTVRKHHAGQRAATDKGPVANGEKPAWELERRNQPTIGKRI